MMCGPEVQRHRTGRGITADGGFALPTVMGVLAVVALISVAAFGTTTGDLRAGASDVRAKQAYAAAEAGVQAYAYELIRDPELHLKCTNTPRLVLNQRVAPGAARQWTTLPGSSAQYAIEILPAKGKTSCVQRTPLSIIDPLTGAFRIRVTGRSTDGDDERKRSVIASFRKPGFTDYVYFSDSEGSQINFVTGDDVNGPLHTNDSVLICGTPRFGQVPSDPIETVRPGSTGRGWTPNSSKCPGSVPQANGVPGVASSGTLGTWVHPAPALEMPASNSSLRAGTDPAYRFKGETWLTFIGNGQMRVTGTREDGVTYNGTTVAQPANGLIYVSNVSCPGPYLPANPYAIDRNGPTKCGTAWVQGTYSQSVTVAAQADIVVFGNFVRSGEAVGGLISNNFIRVYHPLVGGNAYDCMTYPTTAKTNATVPAAAQTKTGHAMTLPLHNLRIDAAILSLQRSFTVDSFGCAPKLSGSLNVTGAIAQKTRGIVGTSLPTGYLKNYTYDRRLKYSTPPQFLDPVRGAWRIAAQQEQVPAQ